jgi:AraC-like DNA-binding protein
MDGILVILTGHSIEYRFDKRQSSLGITITSIGCTLRGEDIPLPSHHWTRNDYLVTCFLGQTGQLETAATGLVKLQPGDVIVVFPGVWHRYGPPEGGRWLEYWISFDGPTIRESFEHRLLDPNQPLIRAGIQARLVRLLEDNMQACVSDGYHGKLVLNLLEILQVVEACLPRRKPDYENGAVQQVSRRIRDNPLCDYRFPDEAKNAGISYELLRKEFVRRLGMPPYRYLVHHRMQYACNLLADGKSVKEACYGLNMSDPAHFSRLFKKVIGIPPKEFVARLR